MMVPTPSSTSHRARQLGWVTALAGFACGLAIVVAPGTPPAIRLLGAAAGILSLSAALTGGRPRAAAAAEQPAAAAAPPDNASMALAVASGGTAQDLQTAMRLLGSAIVEQVDTSVNTVLTENSQMREMASEMASASGQAQEQFKQSMLRAVEAEGSIEELNSFGAELSASIQVIATAVTRSIAVVKDAAAQAAATRGCVEMMATLSAAVAQATRQIDGISHQIRMLALNATIEAARAGTAGLGFAVVADEVKQLSQQTAEATREIGSRIAEMSGMVTNSVAALHSLVGTMDGVDAASSSINDAIIAQSSLAGRVSSNLGEMRDAVFTLSREIREAAQIAANSGMLSDLVLETANSVDGLMTGLKVKLREIGEGMTPPGADPSGSLRDAA